MKEFKNAHDIAPPAEIEMVHFHDSSIAVHTLCSDDQDRKGVLVARQYLRGSGAPFSLRILSKNSEMPDLTTAAVEGNTVILTQKGDQCAEATYDRQPNEAFHV